MSKCPKCGNKLSSVDVLCPRCGSLVEVIQIKKSLGVQSATGALQSPAQKPSQPNMTVYNDDFPSNEGFENAEPKQKSAVFPEPIAPPPKAVVPPVYTIPQLPDLPAEETSDVSEADYLAFLKNMKLPALDDINEYNSSIDDFDGVTNKPLGGIKDFGGVMNKPLGSISDFDDFIKNKSIDINDFDDFMNKPIDDIDGFDDDAMNKSTGGPNDYGDVTDKPTGGLNDYGDVTDKPMGGLNDYGDVTDKPTGGLNDYGDVTDKPTDGLNGYGDVTDKPTRGFNGYSDVTDKPTGGFNGYSDVTNKPASGINDFGSVANSSLDGIDVPATAFRNQEDRFPYAGVSRHWLEIEELGDSESGIDTPESELMDAFPPPPMPENFSSQEQRRYHIDSGDKRKPAKGRSAGRVILMIFVWLVITCAVFGGFYFLDQYVISHYGGYQTMLHDLSGGQIDFGTSADTLPDTSEST